MSSTHLTSCRGFDIRLLGTFVQSSMHQRSDYKPGILMPRDCSTVVQLFFCTKDLASSQGFGVGLLSDSYKSFLHQRSGFKLRF